MSLETILNNRRSIRAFTDQLIAKEQLESIFSLAQRSASNCNVQPWQSYVVSGKTKDQLQKAFFDLIMSGAQPNPDFDWQPKYQGDHRERQFGSANALYGAMGIAREDKKARQASMLRNWTFFDAPYAVFFCMEKYLSIMGSVDMGIYAQTLSLIMSEQGIDSCMQGALGQFPDPVREILNIPDELGILFGMSFGYKDEAADVNKTTTDRVSIEQSVIFFD
ncbi:MAG: nitroreductase [Gammaproteobacteria bacterium]|nr:nitroreductase [Gammaproteobacteria bacterium]MDH5630454.1 nitroreductase [Gammaproteobacteria bacterium]